MTALFAAASFLGSALLFLIEPMIAKMVLPYFGGSPMVWNTSTLVFQLLLLAGYVYTHVTTRRLGPRRQPWLHLALLLPALLALPVALPDDPAPPPDGEPTIWLLRVLLVAIGLPFAVLATTGPLLQRWFSWSAHRRADDPYFLYAASNAGSVVGLLGYPFLIEPRVGLGDQARWWSLAYVVFALLIVSCGAVATAAHRRTAAQAITDGAIPEALGEAAEPVPAASRVTQLAWVGLAFLPSSLMLGVSTHVSTDIAAIPLFWTVPLAVYLATFIVAFARSSRRRPVAPAAVAAILTIPALLNILGEWSPPVWLSITVHLLTLAAVGVAAHGALAAARPPAAQLTRFYLLIAVGGALGGLLNGFLAPVVFDRPMEYPLALALVPLLLLPGGRAIDVVRAPMATVSAVTLGVVISLLLFGSPVIERDRTFYGSYRVTGTTNRHFLYHGTTLHGWEILRGKNAGEPTSYYTRRSPIGQVLEAYADQPSFDRVAFVGMGVGTLAAYGRPGQRMDFYEIDPAIVRMAQDRDLFRYLRRSKADLRVIVGDGRLELARSRSSYGLIVLDAFSSDAIPAHLLTIEALREYRRKLRPGGLLAFHISNRHLELAPVLAAQARELGLEGIDREDSRTSELGTASHWVVLAEDRRDLEPLRQLPLWLPLKPEPGVRAWTDDYSSLVEVLDAG